MRINRTSATRPSSTLRRVTTLAVAVGLVGIAPFSSGSEHTGSNSDSPTRAPHHRGSGGGGFFIDLTCLFGDCNKDNDETSDPSDVAPLAKKGPKLPNKYSLSSLVMHGLVKGGEPFVLDYDTREARLRIEMKLEGAEPFVFNLEGNGRALKIFPLPESFGAEPRVAIISLHAVKDQPGAETPAPLKIYGMGMGKKAVGSVAIDQISFGPSQLRIDQQDEARYSFHSRSDFNKATAEFARVENRDGVIQVVERVNKQDLGELTRNTWVGRDPPRKWDGKDENGEISNGLHVLTVRAWRSSVKEGDWVVSWSPDWVDVK